MSLNVRTIFIERAVRNHPETDRISAAFPRAERREIRKLEDVFGRVHKPYLQKRATLNIFIGRKEGNLVKEAPDAYGVSGDPHYYFIHAYNCIYECEYCYLQGYFSSPDLVLFVNHDDICAEIRKTIRAHLPDSNPWFHAGEFSDSLALAHLTGEWPRYWQLFTEFPRARLELRTKSVNIRPILALGPRPNIIISFSLSPAEDVRSYDRGTPSLHGRLKAIRQLADAGFLIGIHLDPIVYRPDFADRYGKLIHDICRQIPEPQIAYVSLGVIRFTREVYRAFQNNYPTSGLHAAEFVKSFDHKIRYSRPHRLYILSTVRDLCLAAGIADAKVYLCMEDLSAENSTG